MVVFPMAWSRIRKCIVVLSKIPPFNSKMSVILVILNNPLATSFKETFCDVFIDYLFVCLFFQWLPNS